MWLWQQLEDGGELDNKSTEDGNLVNSSEFGEVGKWGVGPQNLQLAPQEGLEPVNLGVAGY